MNQIKDKTSSIVSNSTVNVFFTSLLFMVIMTFTGSAIAKTPEVDVAEKRVLQVTTKIVKLLDQNLAVYSKNQNALNAMISREILPFIDFNAMSKLTLGKHWRTASPAQRTRFINAFREMLIKSYAKTMLDYSGSNIQAGNSVADKKPGFVRVRTFVTPKGSSRISANYRLRKVGDDWKAFNVEIAGIDLITNFRTNFTREISAKGLDALIARLEKSGQ